MKTQSYSFQQACSRFVARLFGVGKRLPHSAVRLNADNMPRHIAIIMDGNGRWAQKRGLPRSAGHAAGTEALRVIITECDELGIEALSIYAFSTENWNRPPEEVAALMRLLLTYFTSEIDELDKKGVCIRILGEISRFDEPQRRALQEAMARTGGNGGLRLNIALNYGGRDELLRAARKLAGRAPEAITREDLAGALDTAGLPDVDLLIRTSGEKRISNFLLYQSAYAELVFDDTLWPDFNAECLRRAIAEYQKRSRRYGGV